MRGTQPLLSLFTGLWVVACGGSSPPAASPEAELATTSEIPAVSAETADTTETTDAAPAADAAPSGAKSTDEAAAEPVFTENMSVAEAIKAVPQGIERANLDTETLSKPLQNLELYDSCKPGSAKVKLQVAVWNGKAVGIDVTTTPKNDTLSECIKGKIRELTWDKKVRSLNTVEYQF